MLNRIHCAAILVFLSSVSVLAADLKVKDSRGTEVTVSNAVIDYGGFMADTEPQGIRLLQGDATVVVRWVDIESLTVVRTDSSVKPPRVELEVVLRSGKKTPAALFRLGAMKLRGKSDLGEYSIDLDKIRTITPIR